MGVLGSIGSKTQQLIELATIPRSTITRMETCRRVGKADDGTFHCIARTALLPTRAASGPASP